MKKFYFYKNTLKYNSSLNVCIVGGGSVGMITSLFLAKNKIKCHVLEKSNELTSKIYE
jgi:2-polyprenyl-6-methoxyphenol hydroxylase-like FAD-dependent oxidoreductase